MDKRRIVEYLQITLGVMIITLGFYFFLLPTNMVTGGVMGLAVSLQPLFIDFISVSTFVLILNVLLLIVGGIFLGKHFFLKTCYATIIYPLFIFVLEETMDPNIIVRELTEGKLLLSALFGGLLVGIGLGLVLRKNATTGGMDIIQKMIHKIFKIPFSVALYITDGLIIIIGIFNFGIEIGFFGIGSMLILGLVIDWVLIAGRSGYTIFIITEEYEKIKEAIYERIERGLTKINVVGGYSKQPKDMIICTIGKSELYLIRELIHELDPKAFSFITKTSEAIGDGFSGNISGDHL